MIRCGQRGHHVRGPQRFALGGSRRGRRPVGRRGRRRPGGQALREGGADGGGAGDDRQLHRAVVGVLGVVGDQRDRRAGVDERALLVGVLAEHRGADGHHDVVAGQRLAQPRPAGGQVPGEQRVVLREAGARGERLLPDRGAQALGQRDQGGPGGGVVGVGADDQRRCVGAGQQVGQRVERGRVGVRPAVQLRRGGERRVVGGLGPVVAGHDHQRRPAAVVRLVPGPGDRARHVLRPGRLVHPHRVVAGQPGEVARQERPVDEVAPVLLPDDHHQRHAVGARGRECTDGVAQPGRGVQVDQRRTARRRGVAGGDPDDRPLVQGEDELQVVGQAGEERDLGGPRVGEDRGHPEPPEDVERGVANRRHRGLPAQWRRPMWSASSSVSGSGSSGAGFRFTSAMHTAPMAATTAKM